MPDSNRPEVEGDLICEALVREIGQASRWVAVREAWQALLTVRRMQKEMLDEQKLFKTPSGMRAQPFNGGDSYPVFPPETPGADYLNTWTGGNSKSD